MDLILLLLFGLAIVALTLSKRREFRGRRLALLRALFPSWRFFEDIDHFPNLLFRMSPGGQDFGPWVNCLIGPERWLGNLFLNPSGNFYFACNTLVDQLISDLNDLEDAKVSEIGNSISYQLVQSLVRFQMVESLGPTENLKFQFKVTLGDEDILVSPIHEV